MDEILTVDDLAASIPEFWSGTGYDVLLAKLPFQALVARDYQGDIQQLGDTVNVHQIPEFDSAEELPEGGKANSEANPLTGIILTINKMLVKDFKITRRGMIQSVEVMSKLRDLAFYAHGKKVNSNIIADIVPSAAAPDHQVGYASGTTLALADILGAQELLNVAKVGDGNRHMVVGAAQNSDMFNIAGFMSRDFVPSANALSSGVISTPVAGFTFHWTTEVGNSSYFFSSEFFQLAFQLQPEVKVYDGGVVGERAIRVNTTMLYGQKQFDNKRVVQIS